MGYKGCMHLDNLKADDEYFLQVFETLHAIFVVSGSKEHRRIRSSSAYCYVCGMRTMGVRLHVCLHCSYFGCRRHIHEHTKIRNHSFAMDLSYGQVHCNHCGDYVYDEQLDTIARANSLSGDTVKMGIFDLLWPGENSEGQEWFANAEKFTMAKRSQYGLRGLLNLDGTCFMNSVLQVLTHTPVLRDYFFTEDHHCLELPEKCLITNLFRDFYNGEKMPLVLNEFLQLIFTQAPHLGTHSQQDAHEFFTAFLDIFHNHCKSSETLNKVSCCSCIVHQVFAGSLQSDLVCPKCKNSRITIEPTIDYSLNLPLDFVGRPKMLEDCLKQYTSVEMVNFMCENCDADSSMTKQLSLKALPIVICFQLKRFETSEIINRKVQTKVGYSEMLDMTPFMTKNDDIETSWLSVPNDNMYILFAVISHIGESPESGHYISYIRYNDDIWFKCNDLIISEVSIEQVLAAEGYLLFYHKKFLNYK